MGFNSGFKGLKNKKNSVLFGTANLLSVSKCREQADFDIFAVKINARPAQAAFSVYRSQG